MGIKNKLDKNNVENFMSLTSLQQGMLFHYVSDEHSTEYHEQLSLTITGDMKIDLLQRAWDFVIENNEMLRTVFRWKGIDNPIQIVLKKHQVLIKYLDFTNELDKHEAVENIKSQDLNNRIDITKETLRIYLCKLDEYKYEMIISNHHIIYDGWSNGIILKELMESYTCLYKSKELKKINKTKFSEFIKYIKNVNKNEHKKYWAKYLQNLDSKDDYFSGKERGIYKEISYKIDVVKANKIKDFAKENKILLSSVLYGAWGLLIAKLSYSSEVLFGTTVSGRPENIKSIDNTVGLFINTIPLRVKLENDATFINLINATNMDINEIKDFENTSLVDIKEYCGLRSNEDIFNSIVIIENYPLDLNLNKDNILSIEKFAIIEKTNYNMALGIVTFDGIEFKFNFNSAAIDEDIVSKLGIYLERLIDILLNSPNIKISEIDLLSEEEKNQILYEFNDTKTDYPKDKTIQELFEEQVEKTPNNIAVVVNEKELTYNELNEKANSLARILRNKGVKADSLVGIMVERSPEMIIGIMAILKAGGAYLPLDSDYPKERIEYMLKDSENHILLIQESLVDNIEFNGESIDLFNQDLFKGDSSNLEKINDSESLAYVIYTSGSTGTPKGVLVEQRNVVRLVKNTNYLDFKEPKILQTGSLAFDSSTFEIWGSLLNGGTLFILNDKEILDVKCLKKNVDRYSIDTVQMVTPLFNQLSKADVSIFENISNVIVGGEVVSPKHIYDVLDKYKGIKIINAYGPTENTTYSTALLIDKRYKGSIPIGKPISNSTAYILEGNNLQPVGAIGELCVAGDGVARGYLNAEEITKKKFVENPFKFGEKIYRTGDLARWLPNGDIEFLGRIDNQVKIRGFRIELGEIEDRLLQHKDIKESAVVVKENKENEKYVCAYVVSEKEISVLKLRSYLKESLPEYMVPTYFVQLEKMPLTHNGKLDRMVLPEPNLEDTLNEYEGPRNGIEEKLVKIWSDVLDIEKVGINSNFFELGGHSLKAMVIISKIHKELNREIPIKELFKAPTIKELSKFIESTEENPYSNIEKVGGKEFYEASSPQKRMYMLQQFEKDSVAYNMPAVFELEGHVDNEKIEETFRKLVTRHEALRTYFVTVEDEIVQKVDNSYEFKLVDRKDNEEIESSINRFVRPFDLEKAPLFRVEFVESREKIYLLIDIHHIISDGVSINILIKEFTAIYNGEALEPLELQYKDFAAWQNNFLKSEEIKNQEEYWINMFNDEIPVLNLPYDYERPAMQSFEGDSVRFEVDEKTTESLRKLAKETGTTMHMVLLSAFNILLSKYSGQEDIVVGIPIAGRPHADLQNVMGIFVNTLVLRNKPEGDKKYLEFLEEVSENSIKSYENQAYEFEELVNKLEVHRDLSRNPLFDVMFLIQTPEEQSIRIENLKFTPYDFENKISKFDMTLTALEQTETIEFVIEYCTKLFKLDTINRMATHCINILMQIVENPNVKLSEIDILSQKEKDQILCEFNNTKAEYPYDKTIHELFQYQVENTPNDLAVVYEDNKLTYKELNERANQVARILRDKGVKPNEIVGMMLERSVEMIVSIMAILKSGGAYLPIDPEYPAERIKYMLEDSDTNLLITHAHLANKTEFEGDIIILEDTCLYKGDGYNLPIVNTSRDMSYIIYTSGTTGNPKGVMIEHRSVVNISNWFNIRYCIKKNRNVLQMTSVSFDVSAEEIFTALLYGGAIFIPPKEVILDRDRFITYIRKNQINIAQFVPITLKALLSEREKLECLNIVISGADRLEDSLSEQIISKGYALYNHYGPTEATIDVISSKCEKAKVVIGKPIYNAQIYIVDKDNKIQPIGVPGELCISGDVLARGYLNRADLTAAKFVSNPFLVGQKMYRTGDLARWLPDGNIEYLCRIDHQVKIRGMRIELEEIESHLIKYESISETVVIDRQDEDGIRYLIAYVVSDKKLKVQELRKYLLGELPHYMIPSYFVQLDEMPLTQNGKIDRKNLPTISKNMDNGVEYIMPTDEIEQKLVDIWQEIFENDHIGINEDFFELGGHSLKATVLVSKIHKELAIKIPLKEIFKRTTIKELAIYIRQMEKNKYVEIKPISERNFYPVSSAQKRIFILSQFEEASTNYNMPGAMIVTGKLDRIVFEKLFNQLVERHESLRTYFIVEAGEIVQKIHKAIDFKIDYSEMEESSIGHAVKAFSTAFDLSKAPLIRVKLVKIGEERHLLFIDMHHIISDGVSMAILIKELVALYEGRSLSPVNIQYKDYAIWQNELFATGSVKHQEEYWLKVFKEQVPMLNLPTDYPRPTLQSFEGNTLVFKADAQLKQKLDNLAVETGTTMYMILLSAYNVLLSKYSNQEDIVVGTPIAGRTHADLQNIVGMFVNTLVMRNYPIPNKRFRQFLSEVKKCSLEAYENQDYQFEQLIEKLDIHRQLSRNPLFDVMFSLENIEPEVEIDDLKFEPYAFDNQVSKFDMTLRAAEYSNGIEFSLEYSTKLFKAETMERMATHFITILGQIVEYPDLCLSEINMMSQKEIQQVLYEFNDTQFDYPKDLTIFQCFEAQVERTPDNIAAIFGDKQMTYSELNEKANKLARRLRSNGVKPDDIVAIGMQRSLEMIVGIFGILKAGGAYLPIDPEYPIDRIDYMLEDSKVQIVLTKNDLDLKFSLKGQIINIEDESIWEEDGSNLQKVNKATDLAYIIYTSGSTGNPKGVMIEHTSVINRINWMNEEYPIGCDDVILQKTPITFDVSVWELFGWSFQGAAVCFLEPGGEKDPEKIMNAVETYKVTTIHFVPSMLDIFLGYINNKTALYRLSSLKRVFTSGEELKSKHVEKFNGLLNKENTIQLLNLYGPTEATVDVSYFDCSTQETYENVPIGKPIHNIGLHILDKNNKMQPIGIAGELHISGVGLARGYLNQPELTAEKFIANPFVGAQISFGDRLYRTGDLARWLPDGSVEFLGRIDHQVKIRGYRIELKEIEMKLLNYPPIKNAVVLDREDHEGSKYLCGYIVADQVLTLLELRSYLSKTLPDYMVPTHFKQIDEIPLNSNGKVDRKSLFKISTDISIGTEYKAPTNNTEEILTTLWAEILELNIEKISITDTFFNLGGNSISIMKLTNRINDEFKTNMKITDLFNLTTIEQIAIAIDGNDKNIEDDEMIKFIF